MHYKYLLFILILIPIVFCPGPMTLFSMATSIKIGARRTLFALSGGSSAYLCQLILISFGLGLVLQHSIIIFDVIKWAGAAYLIFLGVKLWRTQNVALSSAVKIKAVSAYKLYAQGFLVGISNPKSIIVFTALFPHFINTHADKFPQLCTLSVLFLILQFTSAISYACFGAKTFNWLRRKNKERLQLRIAGGMLIAAGAALAVVRE